MSEDKCRNWFELSLCLLKTREGFLPFIKEKSRDLHTQIKIAVCNRSTHAATTRCTHCTSTDIHKTKAKKNVPPEWTISCPNGICDIWLEEILAHHAYGPGSRVYWTNTDPGLWQRDVWEVMKVFQPQGCQNHKDADDADCTSLISLMLDCSYFNQFISNPQILRDVKEIRNILMHSNNMEITRWQVRTYGDKMVVLMQDPTHLRSLRPCRKAVREIRELMDRSYKVTFTWKEWEYFRTPAGSQTVRITKTRVLIAIILLLTWWNWVWVTTVMWPYIVDSWKLIVTEIASKL